MYLSRVHPPGLHSGVSAGELSHIRIGLSTFFPDFGVEVELHGPYEESLYSGGNPHRASFQESNGHLLCSQNSNEVD